MPSLILASTSSYRQQLLARLGIPFEQRDPGIGEPEIPGEYPADRALRLANAKAAACLPPAANPSNGPIIIGSDQVASHGGKLLHKPGTPEKAVKQLLACQNQQVDFYTGVAVHHGSKRLTHVDHTSVHFRQFGEKELRRYVELDSPLQSAGGFRIESLGVVLFRSVDTHDPTALIGLPLIWLAASLQECGIDPLVSE